LKQKVEFYLCVSVFAVWALFATGCAAPYEEA